MSGAALMRSMQQHMMHIRTAAGAEHVQAYMVCKRTGRQAWQAVRIEPTPHPGCGYSVYISPLLSEQILSVKIGKNMLKPVSYSLHQSF